MGEVRLVPVFDLFSWSLRIGLDGMVLGKETKGEARREARGREGKIG